MISKFLNKYNISKKKLFTYHTKIWFFKGQGALLTGNYISLIQSVGNWGVILTILFKWDIAKVGKWIILLIIINISLDLIAGYFYIKSGLKEYEGRYMAKSHYISPQWVELEETLKETNKALKVPHHFIEL